ncbi:MAG: maltokinase [Actinomycetota bacterium]|nr:maltokinase [Actinomycetota bacterium]
MTAPPFAGSIPELLGPWLTRQRWYAAKSAELTGLRRIGGLRLADPPAPVGVEVHVVRAETASGDATTYQVPLTYRSSSDPALTHALVGVFTHPGLGERWVYDGTHDPAFVDALLRLLAGGHAVAVDRADAPDAEGPREDGGHGGAVGVMQRSSLPAPGPARVLSGEQSNTSIIIGPDGPDPMIIKLFRVLHAGPNPDVVVQTRLAAAGCDRVPRPVGWIEGSWADPVSGSLVEGHLAYACEFLPDGDDAWRVACRAVERNESFTAEAHDLGVATAQVHTALASAMPTVPADPSVLERIADGLAARARWAVGQVPALAPFASAALAEVDEVRALHDLPDLQQIHGDYHLGQVLHSPARGWVLLDFEGEPLRPLAERLAPDLALRDVAGMLRSFDYASRHATVALPAGSPRAVAARVWSAEARHSFLLGYAEGGGRAGDEASDAESTLLRALEIDKAMYEVVYETLNRPSWVGIPLTALRRFTTRS